MKRILHLTLIFALAANVTVAHGQRLKLGAAYLKAQKKKTELAGRKAADGTVVTKTAEKTARKAADNVRIDESADVQGDNQYRYVFAYNKNKERSSETIYKRHRENNVWGDEVLYNKGIYTYEYDTQERIISKTVRYEKDDTEFVSYNISVSYNDEYTEYTRCDIAADGSYVEDSKWSIYVNGRMRSYTKKGYSSADSYTISYDSNGNYAGYSWGDGTDRRRTLTGSLNDSTITTVEWGQTVIESYRYDPEVGKLTEYKRWGDGYDARKYEYVYDQFGRITAEREYGSGDDDESVDTGASVSAKSMLRTNGSITDEPEWRLEDEAVYRYWNGEVYGVGNTWHDVFGMDGPLSSFNYADNIDSDTPWVESLQFNRNSEGKLTHVVTDINNHKSGDHEFLQIDVDNDGRIIRQQQLENYSWEGYWYNDTVTAVFGWENIGGTDYVVTADRISTYVDEQRDDTIKTHYDFAYADGRFVCDRTGDDGKQSTEVQATDNGMRIVQGEDCFVQEVQTENVSFVRPNLLKDYDGFTPDSTIVVSVKDRVVVCNSQHDPYIFTHFDNGVQEGDAYTNTTYNTYFSVSHSYGLTICKNIDNLPVYILQDGRLIKEYIYEEDNYGVNVGGMANDDEASKTTRTRINSVAEPIGTAYTCITYTYDTDGLVTGQTISKADNDGVVTDEVTVEVKYDPTSTDIDNLEVATDGLLTINGRTLGMSNGQKFCIYALDGKPLAIGVHSFRFATAGIYLIKVGGKTCKMSIR